MKVIVDIAIIPIGVGVSLSAYVAECEKIFRAAGLEPRLHPNGTDIEGEWDPVMNALRACHERLHEMGAPRVATNIRIGTRNDRLQNMDDKMHAVISKTGEK